jgi:arylformamidase
MNPSNKVFYYDITPPITEDLAVFPGDQPFQRQVIFDFKKQDHLYLSTFLTTSHIGAHADSSSHYHADGEGVEQRPLDAYFGDCQVFDIQKVKDQKENRIYPADLSGEVTSTRVLFKTLSFPNLKVWNSDFFSLSPELIYFLNEKKVKLVGIDTPSVDPETSKKLESHQALFATKMAVLEGLSLEKVPQGHYFLVALPLPFVGADASPVRAILLESQALPNFELQLRK